VITGRSVFTADEEDATNRALVDRAHAIVRDRSRYVATTENLARSIERLNGRLGTNFQELRSVLEERVAIERQIAELKMNQKTLEIARRNEEDESDSN